jgi:hypothetical protein
VFDVKENLTFTAGYYNIEDTLQVTVTLGYEVTITIDSELRGTGIGS